MSPVSGSVTARAPPASPKQTFLSKLAGPVQNMLSSTSGVNWIREYSALHKEWSARGSTRCFSDVAEVRNLPQPHPVMTPDCPMVFSRPWPLSGSGMGVTLSLITTAFFSWIRARSLSQSDRFWKPGWRTTYKQNKRSLNEYCISSSMHE